MIYIEKIIYYHQKINERMDISASSPIDNPNFRRGGYGLVSTVEDFFRFSQMLLNQGQLDGKRILSRKTLELMHMNHLPSEFLPIGFASDAKLMGYGFGLGSRVMVDVAKSGIIGSVGEYGWAGAAKTYYWIDPKEELIGLFFTQAMLNFSMILRHFQTLVYQAIID
ncbi:serine hydrolase domain-containing protein [Legionella oakridgensis]|uniref:Beta-lactamase class C and other penicillin binding protein n=2 Tax=Legionella oakridgensis TaxID=29423 RepID=W0BBQ8_9GAMM|nr:serine hydrolase [Legionella oakridgensis]AHE65849.1 beta-lactamase class C and other penicillin binding protein [Legionella oakridgensis ATCC 33761 = DSM 21215]KTD37303.1 Beta-lactamase [Legionella oakridgensis]STY15785.1 Uncharacterized protein conserved in bacteria [Legionella longbeachae]